MFQIFKKSTPDTTVVAEPKADLRNKSVNEIIEEIHHSFYSEVDKLLASAKIANSLDTDQHDLIEKCNRLKSLGFTNTKEVKEAEAEILRLSILQKDNEAKKNLIEAINYFSFKYPNYKFITEESVKKICHKYNLIYGAIDKYIGTVPDKNLKQMEDFKVLENDECYVHKASFVWDSALDLILKYETLVDHNKRINARADNIDVHTRIIDMKCPLEIAAPIKDFNMDGMEVKDFKISKIEIPDPVVLKPVIFNKQKHYLIVTAWGIEAGDDLVVNSKHN